MCALKLSLLSRMTPSRRKVLTTLTSLLSTTIDVGKITFRLLQMNIKCVLGQLMSNLLNLHHSTNGARTRLKSAIKQSISLADLYKVVSSANSLQPTSLRKNGKSLIKIKKNSGPRADPCGTPSLVDFDKTSTS